MKDVEYYEFNKCEHKAFLKILKDPFFQLQAKNPEMMPMKIL